MPRKWKAILFLAVVGLIGFAAYASGADHDWLTIGFTTPPSTPDDGTILIADEGRVEFDGNGEVSFGGSNISGGPSALNMWASHLSIDSPDVEFDSDVIDLAAPYVFIGEDPDEDGQAVISRGALVGVVADSFIGYTGAVFMSAGDDGALSLSPSDSEADPPAEAISSLSSTGEARLYATGEEEEWAGVTATSAGQVTMANQTGTALYVSVDGDVIVQFGPAS